MGFHVTPPPAAISRVLARFDREDLAGFITVAIDLLDLAEGETEVELNGDEEDGSFVEDDFGIMVRHGSGGPGCSVSDPGENEHDAEQVDEDGEDETLPDLPVYGADQSQGPTNCREAGIEYQARLQGLVRSPTGGWRVPS